MCIYANRSRFRHQIFISMSNVQTMEFDPDIDIQVLDGVYEPAEDSFLLLRSIDIRPGIRILEVGTGSGFIALHCAKAGVLVTATDISPVAVETARSNAKRNSLQIDIVQTDLASGISGKFDIILFNPPYITGEDGDVLTKREKEQLVGGSGGHEISIRFLDEVHDLLCEGGDIFLLTSSQSENNILEYARGIYEMEHMLNKELFFERLSVYRFNKTV